MTKALLFAALLAGTALTSQAQQNSFDAQVAIDGLLRMPAVQQELGITPQQSKAIAKASSSQASAMSKAWRDARALAAIRAQIRQTTLAQISPAQLTRLREISLQQIGAQALGMPVVAGRVGLSEDQRKAVNSTYTSLIKQALEAIRNTTAEYAKGPDGRTDPAKLQAAAAMAQQAFDLDQVRQLAAERSLAMLSEEQRANWKKLLGRPFKTAISPAFRSGGGAQP